MAGCAATMSEPQLCVNAGKWQDVTPGSLLVRHVSPRRTLSNKAQLAPPVEGPTIRADSDALGHFHTLRLEYERAGSALPPGGVLQASPTVVAIAGAARWDTPRWHQWWVRVRGQIRVVRVVPRSRVVALTAFTRSQDRSRPSFSAGLEVQGPIAAIACRRLHIVPPPRLNPAHSVMSAAPRPTPSDQPS